MDGCLRRARLLIPVLCLLCAHANTSSWGAEAEWIWLPGVAKEQVVEGSEGYFRKTINLKTPADGRITIAADDAYELYVNGRRIGTGRTRRKVDAYNISSALIVGRNVIAVKVDNLKGNTAALMARVEILPKGTREWFTFSTDSTWKTTSSPIPMWQTASLNDRSWLGAQSFGILGETVPWDRQEAIAAEEVPQETERFQIQPGFAVQRLVDQKKAGSLIAMAFNEFGHIIASRENGPLLLIFDRDKDGVPEEVRIYCDQVESVQGILPLNGEVFVTGQGPEGTGLYRLTDKDRNGTLEEVRRIVAFTGSPGEHGPHGLALGSDGMIYCTVGNHMQVDRVDSTGTTLRSSYEGDLVPRYEDPGGHARGIKAPGGTIIRTDTEGRSVQRVAGGLRNAYDLVFHADGGLFVHDSDMESDVGATFYRETAFFEIAEGGEYGWRSGWSTWPNYYADRLPPVLETGRGSPSGAAVYDHFMYPVRYHNTLFLADWSEGRILNVRVKPQGGTFNAESEVFLQGQPLNVTDLAIGPDGSLHFCTGGRGTSGGIYRVTWNGTIPDRVKNLGTGVAAAIRQPQLDAAWTRQKLAGIKAELGSQWGELVAGVAYSDENPPHYRTRALDLMQLFGPVPSDDLLVDLSEAGNETVRAKATQLLGLHPGSKSQKRLIELLEDGDARVRRLACEAMLRSDQLPTAGDLFPLLAEEDHSVRFAARRLLERIPVDQWRDDVLASADAKIAILGSMALVIADPTHPTALEVLAKMSKTIPEFLSDSEFIDLLRTCQLAITLGGVKPAEIQPLAKQIAEEFPAGEIRVNRELIRLAAALGSDALKSRALDYLEGDAPMSERLHVGLYLRFLPTTWTPEQQFKLLRFYELAAVEEAGSSVPLYIMNATRDFGREVLNEKDARTILSQGKAWPNAALAALYKIPQPIDQETANVLRNLDTELHQDQAIVSDVYRRLRTGIIALLASSANEESFAYLRQIWREDPERRQGIALALSLNPDGDNWDYLVRSLNVLEGAAAGDVMKQLATVQVATDDPEALRQVIILGLRADLEGSDPRPATKLLSHWTGILDEEGNSPSLEVWQQWYAKTYPERPSATLPSGSEDTRWDLEQLVTYLSSDQGKSGDPMEGKGVYQQATCVTCHRFGNVGESVGPDLTNISRRFTKREVLESILFPSHVISDQYMNRRVITLDGRAVVGLVADAGNGDVTVRNSANETTTIKADEIDQILPNASSIMPGNLLDPLSLKQISDLMAYLGVLPPLEVASRPR